MRLGRDIVVGICAAGLAAGAAGCRRADDVTVLKLAHSLSTRHPVHAALELMARRAAELSGGTLRIDIYPGEQLGSEREAIELVQLGVLALTKTSTATMEGFVPALRVYGLPYLFRDSAHMWQVLEGPVGARLLEAGVPKGLRGLCYYDAGARSFYTTRRRVVTPGDLAGLKIRTQQSEMAIRTVEALGGAPTPVDWGELYTALQQGLVDGAENNPPSFYNSHHYEVCRFYTLDEHLRVPDVIVISPRAWDGLAPAQQAALMQAAHESVAYQRALWAEMEAEALQAVQAAGVEVIRPDQQPFRQAVAAVWRDLAGTEIGALAERIRALE